MRTARWKLAVVFCLIASATPALSHGLRRTRLARLPGITAQGNLSSESGTQAVRKSYLDPRTGIVVELTQGRVENKLGWPLAFVDTGWAVSNSLPGHTQPATADQLLIGPARSGPGGTPSSNAILIATFDPANTTPRTCYISMSSTGQISCTCTPSP